MTIKPLRSRSAFPSGSKIYIPPASNSGEAKRAAPRDHGAHGQASHRVKPVVEDVTGNGSTRPEQADAAGSAKKPRLHTTRRKLHINTNALS